MKNDPSPALYGTRELESLKNQLITQSFFSLFDVILTSFHEPVIVLDADLKVVRANHPFYRTFQVNAGEVEGVIIYDLDNGQWDIPGLRELLENILPETSKYDDFEVEHDFGTLGYKILHFNARLICSDDDQIQLIFLAIADVTNLEFNRRGLEQLVEKRLVDLIEAQKEAETALTFHQLRKHPPL